MTNEDINNKYPFLDPRNSDEWAYGNCEGDSWFEECPDGWRNIFLDMCEKIKAVLEENNLPLESLKVHQVKEKWGTLRFYYECPDIVRESMRDIACHYEDISYQTCIMCGERATKISKRWISPYCDKCFKG